MKILITGGAGFIGSHVCEKLLAMENEVVCVDDFNNFYNPSFKEENIKPFAQDKNFKLFRCDITNEARMKEIFEIVRPERVIHLAARAGVRPSLENPILYGKVNIMGTLNLLNLARDFGVTHFIFASSSSVYGNNTKIPFSENDNVDHPISPYAASKKAGELLCHTYHHLYNTDTVCLRFFNVYGPKGRPDMAPYIFTKSILEGRAIEKFGDGKSTRDHTFVSDIIEGIVAAQHIRGYEIINLGHNKPVELNYFIRTIENILGMKAQIKIMPWRKGDVIATYADISKAKRLLGWQPKVPFEEGMEHFIEWYKQHGRNTYAK